MIDYRVISDAVAFYGARGYRAIDVPWLVGAAATTLTSPGWVRQFETWAGYLPGSGEQSFLELRLRGDLADGRYVCVTPCYRDEQPVTALHRQTFLKVEIISLHTDDPSLPVPDSSFDAALNELGGILTDAKEFMRVTGVDPSVTEQTNEQGHPGYDLVARGVELGSYGVRRFADFSWAYGTGVAEPRFSRVRDGGRP